MNAPSYPNIEKVIRATDRSLDFNFFADEARIAIVPGTYSSSANCSVNSQIKFKISQVPDIQKNIDGAFVQLVSGKAKHALHRARAGRAAQRHQKHQQVAQTLLQIMPRQAPQHSKNSGGSHRTHPSRNGYREACVDNGRCATHPHRIMFKLFEGGFLCPSDNVSRIQGKSIKYFGHSQWGL